MPTETPTIDSTDDFSFTNLTTTLDHARKALWDHDPIHTERIEWIRVILRRAHENPDQSPVRRCSQRQPIDDVLDGITSRNARGYMTVNAAAADVQRCLMLIAQLRAEQVSQTVERLSLTHKVIA